MALLTNFQNNQAKQLNLFEEAASAGLTMDKKSSSFNDPAFASNKSLPIHRWVPWIAGFASEFVRDALTRYLKNPGVLLDPFAGVGTTLVAGMLAGHQTIGFEINPYAVLACRAKLNAYSITSEAFSEEILKFQTFFKERISSQYIPKSLPPKGFKTRTEFYSPLVLHKVLILQDFIATIKDNHLRDLFRLAFASTMISYSNYSYEPSLGRRVSAGKDEIKDFPVAQIVLKKLREMAEDVAWLQTHMLTQKVNTQIINDSFFNYENYLAPASVDLIITSPPYLNNYHYNRNTRPQLYWLNFAQSPQDFKQLENSNFGKYWQTVREQACLDLHFTLPETDLAERLHLLRKINPERGIYGGNGWANYAAAYFNDCYEFTKAVHSILKPGATALIVIGNSILQGILIPTDQYFGKIAEVAGLELVSVDIPRTTRVGNSIIQSNVRVTKAQDSHQLYEAVVVLQKNS